MTGETIRLHAALYGAVQGIGFRPFVYRLAREMKLNGTVLNSSAGLIVEVEGSRADLDLFLQRLDREKPPAAVVLARETAFLAPVGFTGFEILPSDGESAKSTAVLPDLATCPECLSELLDPSNRRFNYPFTNCTRCGPRYTIVLDIPYDRSRTIMREFDLCPDCLREYTDPEDRRFHAQPNACSRCGPSLERSISEAARDLEAGRILALKGIGGFQLLVDARNYDAVLRLRQRKRREEKPFALMMPSIEAAHRFCLIAPKEEELLRSSAAPIVLLRPKNEPGLASNVAHNSPYLGVMLPYTPLHHLLMREFPYPVVATSGNLTDEPIAIDNDEARSRLGGITDEFLMHNRPIARPCDDSVARLVRGRPAIIRRARGYAPLPVRVGHTLAPVLASGAHMKNTVAIASGSQVFISQHIGDLDTVEARATFEKAIDDLCRLYNFKPELVACDLHPDYASSRWARESGLPVVEVQHHQAHVAACAAENGVKEPYLGVAWDGTGYGLDGTVWGGEFFVVENGGFVRISHLRPFRLPGGEAAIRQGWRSAAGLLWELYGPEGLEPLLSRMLETGLNSPLTTSIGRLFDAAASIAGVARENLYEGHAAMLFERSIAGHETNEAYPLPGGDWRPLIEALQADAGAGVPAAKIAARFHNALANWIVDVATHAGLRQVCLSGGVFQNGYLVERASALLEWRGFRVFTHERVPANDGGIALGQAVIAGQLPSIDAKPGARHQTEVNICA